MAEPVEQPAAAAEEPKAHTHVGYFCDSCQSSIRGDRWTSWQKRDSWQKDDLCGACFSRLEPSEQENYVRVSGEDDQCAACIAAKGLCERCYVPDCDEEADELGAEMAREAASLVAGAMPF